LAQPVAGSSRATDPVVPRVLIDTAPIPGGGELRLIRRGADFMIMLGGNELMSSRVSGSEVALADLTCAPLATAVAPRILIGGLGMGFTLRAALTQLGRGADVVVAELVPAVIAWARGPMAALHGDSLDDPRVRIVEADVADLLRDPGNGYDAVLLDVDNGPDGLTRGANDRLYGATGLATARTALRQGGVLAVWSAAPDAAFARRLRDAGLAVEEVAARAAGGKGARHVIWLARKA
jgi:spermidine synthase